MDVRLEIFRRLLAPLRPGRLVDLGSGHGKFALVARDLGWAVTAVDARKTRMPMAPGIEWVQADVRDFPLEGYDCICVLGLLYHLELADALALLEKAAGTTTIIDTHVALEAEREEQGYVGRTYVEVRSRDPNVLARTSTAAWGNRTSFWPTQESLLRMFYDSGFATVFVAEPPYLADRTFYLCV